MRDKLPVTVISWVSFWNYM